MVSASLSLFLVGKGLRGDSSVRKYTFYCGSSSCEGTAGSSLCVSQSGCSGISEENQETIDYSRVAIAAVCKLQQTGHHHS